MRSVIVVDDSDMEVEALTRFFTEGLNYNVVATGSNGVEAIELYKLHSPDLITLDLNMPVMGGLKALEMIMAHDPAACALVVTTIRTMSHVVKAIQLGATSYINKPVQPDNEIWVSAHKKEIEDALAMLATRSRFDSSAR